METVGEHPAILGMFEGRIKVKICDCGGDLSSVEAYLDGRATGYYVGVHRAAESLRGVDAHPFGQLGYACDVDAPPTAEAIGELVHQALEWAWFLQKEEMKNRGVQ